MRESMVLICPTRQAKVRAADWHDGHFGHKLYAEVACRPRPFDFAFQSAQRRIRTICNKPLRPQVEAFWYHPDTYSTEPPDASGVQHYRRYDSALVARQRGIMLGNCLIRTPMKGDNSLDLGALGEALLFFSKTHVILDQATLPIIPGRDVDGFRKELNPSYGLVELCLMPLRSPLASFAPEL